MHIYEVLVRPIVTEKSMAQRDDGKYAFEVNRRANKHQIKEAVEKIFDVEVEKVATIQMKGKKKRWGRHNYQSKDWKKAIITLSEGDSITYFEGV
jgi:large subunit ribosomal protein L23